MKRGYFGMQSETSPLYKWPMVSLLLPTTHDPFPNVILEAMACGLPVITITEIGGAEFIVDGRNGYVCDAWISRRFAAGGNGPARARAGSAQGGHAR